jgi:serine/threonine-protein kinase
MDRVIAAGMAKNPDERYPSTRDLASAARAALTSPIPPANNYPTPPPQHATQFAPQHRPTQFAPTQQQHPGAPAPPLEADPSKRKLIWASGITATVALIALIAVVAIPLFGDEDKANTATTPTASTPTVAPNAGPFTGTFSAAFGARTNWGGTPDPASTPAKETWTFNSACPTGGSCVATASAGGPITETPTWVFDQVADGQWVAVSVAPGTCQGIDAEYWRIIRLRKAADGSLTGDYGSLSTKGCASKRSLSLVRTGDADLAKLADPNGQPPRVRSPAEALHGLYHSKVAHVPGPVVEEIDLNLLTDCLRTGDRCVTVLTQPGLDRYQLLLFAADKWTQDEEYTGGCPAAVTQTRETSQYPLPQPAQDPIAVLTGNGHREIIASNACDSGDYTSTFTRVGD